jgi:hypothetical protein
MLCVLFYLLLVILIASILDHVEPMVYYLSSLHYYLHALI